MNRICKTAGWLLTALLSAACSNGQTPGEEEPVVDAKTADEPKAMAYGRFVPEREDDFTWENDKVAFRIYGPSRGVGGKILMFTAMSSFILRFPSG